MILDLDDSETLSSDITAIPKQARFLVAKSCVCKYSEWLLEVNIVNISYTIEPSHECI